ncbi:hypothetical protein [Rufibacter hautae]|uniref:hypothetical protein n=1 Tax=Rufibacter hautae TaxID=2595005 RepID=UPI00167FFBD2|nr:hypothetical protein [Rufibacter hautae]
MFTSTKRPLEKSGGLLILVGWHRIVGFKDVILPSEIQVGSLQFLASFSKIGIKTGRHFYPKG